MIYLCSEGSVTIPHIHEHHLAPQGLRSVLFIRTANEVMPDKEWEEETRQVWRKCGYGLTEYSVAGASAEDFSHKLEDHDLVYCNGGYAPYLLYHFRQNGLDRMLARYLQGGGVYIGSSAGALVMGPHLGHVHEMYLDYGSTHLTEVPGEYTEALGHVSFTLLPHWGTPGFHDFYMRDTMRRLWSQPHAPYILLQDSQYLIYDPETAQTQHIQTER